MQTRSFRFVLAALTLALVLAGMPGPISAQDGGALDANLTDSCADSYDPDLNYFPEQVAFEYAGGVTVEYFNNYKLVTVTEPWDGATEADAFQYVLVQCGTPAPEDVPAGALVLDVPVATVMTMSTTQLPHFAVLGILGRLTGVDQITYVSDPDVIARYAAGDIIEIGYGAAVNVELVLDAEPNLVMAYGLGSPESDAHPVLREAGVPFAMNAEHAENSPLGRAEWLKFTALFFNQEGAANDIFADIAADYEALAALTADIPAAARPSLLPNTFSPWTEAWSIPGASSYAGQLYADAGAALVLSGDPAVDEADYSVL
ncbi:MAG: ABC transporter substrate-binding protein, partial [Anaerolineae bacterium]|nr:ABC transporter substrate-binding protein [Anaerolineae bacterium]